MTLTDEQAVFLQSLEEEFANRYTEMEEEFKAVLNAKPSTPPVCENYFERPDQREGYDDNRDHSYNSSYRRNRFRSRGYGDYNSRDKFRKRSCGDYNNVRDRSANFRDRRDYREHYSSSPPYESVNYCQDY